MSEFTTTVRYYIHEQRFTIADLTAEQESVLDFWADETIAYTLDTVDALKEDTNIDDIVCIEIDITASMNCIIHSEEVRAMYDTRCVH